MKRINLLYWIFTGLFGAYMIFSAIPDALLKDEAVALVHDQLGYPLYFIVFIGVAKLLGSITILIPGLPRMLKEWAYAGLIFDLIGATYSIMKVMPNAAGFIIMSITIIVGLLSYYFYSKKMKLAGQN